MGDIDFGVERLKQVGQKFISWLRRVGFSGLVVIIAASALVIFAGAGITLAATGTQLFSLPVMSTSPTATPSSGGNGSNSSTGDNASIDPDSIHNSSVTLDKDPGERASYEGGSLGVRFYDLPDGVRVAVVVRCLRATANTIDIQYVYQQLRGDHDVCTGGGGTRVGVSYFFPSYQCLLPVIRVTLNGTDFDGTYTHQVPPNLVRDCSSPVQVTQPQPASTPPSQPVQAPPLPQVLPTAPSPSNTPLPPSS